MQYPGLVSHGELLRAGERVLSGRLGRDVRLALAEVAVDRETTTVVRCRVEGAAEGVPDRVVLKRSRVGTGISRFDVAALEYVDGLDAAGDITPRLFAADVAGSSSCWRTWAPWRAGGSSTS